MVGFVRLAPEWRYDTQSLSAFFFTADNGREYLYARAYDTYTWLRAARNLLRTGSPCDAVRDGVCRDELTTAPIGADDRYSESWHVRALATTHRFLAWISPGYPLESSGRWLTWWLGLLAVLPTFAIALRLGGPVAGLGAVGFIHLNSYYLMRSTRPDTDVWNVLMPIAVMWAVIRAIDTASQRQAIGFTLVAACLTVLHGKVWSGYLLTYALAAAGLGVAGAFRFLRSGRLANPLAGIPALLVPVATFTVAIEALALLTGLDSPTIALLFNLGVFDPTASNAEPMLAERVAYPSNFTLVNELEQGDLWSVINRLGGHYVFMAAWIFAGIAAFPRTHRWLALIGALLSVLLWNLVDFYAASRTSLALFVATPLAVATGIAARKGDPRRAAAAGAIAIWLVVGLHLSVGGRRFFIFLLPPLGIALFVGIGWLQQWIADQLARDRDGRDRPPLSPVVQRIGPPLTHIAALSLVAWILYTPVQIGMATAMARYPRVNDAWHETLRQIRRDTTPETIVNSWWDYGYFIKYYAERRVSADGGSLLTRVPHRVGQALLARTDREAVGWLRMLNCASDVDESSAYERLRANGFNPLSAEAMLSDLVRMNKGAADRRLMANRLGRRAREDILAATHCDAPPSLLLLSTEMINMPAWWYLGGWDPARAAVENSVRGRPRDQALEILRESGFSAADAEDAWTQIERGQWGRDASKFVANASPLLTSTWLPCHGADGGGRVCPIGRFGGAGGVYLDSFRYDEHAPGSGVFRIAASATPDAWRRAVPSQVVVAGPTDIRRYEPADASAGPLLIDEVNHQILVGPMYLLESTFVRLMFLRGDYSTRQFEKFSENDVPGERVLAWRVVGQ